MEVTGPVGEWGGRGPTGPVGTAWQDCNIFPKPSIPEPVRRVDILHKGGFHDGYPTTVEIDGVSPTEWNPPCTRRR